MPVTHNPFRSFLFKIFVLNEKTRLTDKDLLDAISVYWFGRAAINLQGYGRAKTKLSRWRSEFNNGRLGVPPVMSFRYNEDKKPCNQRLRSLSAEEIQRKLLMFPFKDDRHVSSFTEARREDSSG